MSDFHRWSQVHIPLTHLAHLTPNQHTPTCRSINDLVLKQPAYPQIEDVLGSCPFPSPIEQVYLELHYTAGCEAEPLFHNPFTTKVHLLGPQHTRTTEGHTRVQFPFLHLRQVHTQGSNPYSPPHCPSAEPFQLPFM